MSGLQLLKFVLNVMFGATSSFFYRDILKQTGCYPSEPKDVSQKEKEEA